MAFQAAGFRSSGFDTHLGKLGRRTTIARRLWRTSSPGHSGPGWATGPERVCQAGESFYEPANAVHHVSANASMTEPVTFIAVFVASGNSTLTVTPAG